MNRWSALHTRCIYKDISCKQYVCALLMLLRVDGQLAMSRALGDFNYKVDPDLTDKEYKVSLIRAQIVLWLLF